MTADVLAFTAEPRVQWRQRRSEMTHDWLRNRLLPRLHASIAIACGDAAASPAAIENIIAAIREWPLRRAAALRVATDYAAEVSPLREAGRISESLPADTGQYVRATALGAWALRHDLCRRLVRISRAGKSADAIYDAWSRISSARPVEEDLSPSLSYLRDLAAACQEFAAALSDLPADAIL